MFTSGGEPARLSGMGAARLSGTGAARLSGMGAARLSGMGAARLSGTHNPHPVPRGTLPVTAWLPRSECGHPERVILASLPHGLPQQPRTARDAVSISSPNSTRLSKDHRRGNRRSATADTPHRGLPCDATTCPTGGSEGVWYADSNHLTILGRDADSAVPAGRTLHSVGPKPRRRAEGADPVGPVVRETAVAYQRDAGASWFCAGEGVWVSRAWDGEQCG